MCYFQCPNLFSLQQQQMHLYLIIDLYLSVVDLFNGTKVIHLVKLVFIVSILLSNIFFICFIFFLFYRNVTHNIIRFVLFIVWCVQFSIVLYSFISFIGIFICFIFFRSNSFVVFTFEMDLCRRVYVYISMIQTLYVRCWICKIKRKFC